MKSKIKNSYLKPSYINLVLVFWKFYLAKKAYLEKTVSGCSVHLLGKGKLEQILIQEYFTTSLAQEGIKPHQNLMRHLISEIN